MNKRERFLAFASFRNVDRVPYYAEFVPALRDTVTKYFRKKPGEYFDIDKWKGAGLRPPDGFQPPDYSAYYPGYTNGEDGFSIDEFGCGHLSHGFYHFTEYISPLRNATSLEEIEKYPIVSNTSFLDDKMREACAAAHRDGDVNLAFFAGIYENAWQVRGQAEILIDLVTRREWAESLLDRYCDNAVRSAAAAARAGYDCIGSAEDVATQNSMLFGPDLWREVLKSRWARVIDAAREIKPDIHFWYHSDGNVWDILDDLVEIGVTILNPVQPECMDPVAVRRRYGKRLAFDGCIGTQTTFPFGTPESMRRTVTGLAERLDAGHGGLMLSPSHVLEPEVPPENVEAFFKACDGLTYDL